MLSVELVNSLMEQSDDDIKETLKHCKGQLDKALILKMSP